MPVPIYQVDAFAGWPFHGNPAAVCILSEERDDEWMLAVAQEMSVSDTAYVREEEGRYNLRWFTPTVEVDLCGHATLASAHVLWETGRLEEGSPARFHTRSGILTAERRRPWIEVDFPAMPPQEVEPPPGLIEALGVLPEYVGANDYDYLVEVASPQALRDIRPAFGLLAEIEMRGVAVTCAVQGSEYDFLSRFFAPALGIDEDPVTGSAHCCLGPYWQSRLGKSEMVAFQASRRGGVVRVRVQGERVKIGGQAITILRGELADPPPDRRKGER
jgi:predicted PhzF superfamily epimerase YddE/YHI9